MDMFLKTILFFTTIKDRYNEFLQQNITFVDSIP